jgi:hypothetical protein
MPAHRAQPHPVARRPRGSARRRIPRPHATTRRAAGELALLIALLIAALPASPSAAPTSVGGSTTAGGDGAVLEPAPVVGSPRQRAVFVCQQDGLPVFTDRPCGSATEQRTLTVEAPPPGAAPNTSPPRPRASTRPRLQPEEQPGTGRAADTRCATLRRQLDELDARMRAGYSSREAARLWNRWRELKGRLRAERC